MMAVTSSRLATVGLESVSTVMAWTMFAVFCAFLLGIIAVLFWFKVVKNIIPARKNSIYTINAPQHLQSVRTIHKLRRRQIEADSAPVPLSSWQPMNEMASQSSHSSPRSLLLSQRSRPRSISTSEELLIPGRRRVESFASETSVVTDSGTLPDDGVNGNFEIGLSDAVQKMLRSSKNSYVSARSEASIEDVPDSPKLIAAGTGIDSEAEAFSADEPSTPYEWPGVLSKGFQLTSPRSARPPPIIASSAYLVTRHRSPSVVVTEHDNSGKLLQEHTLLSTDEPPPAIPSVSPPRVRQAFASLPDTQAPLDMSADSPRSTSISSSQSLLPPLSRRQRSQSPVRDVLFEPVERPDRYAPMPNAVSQQTMNTNHVSHRRSRSRQSHLSLESCSPRSTSSFKSQSFSD